MKRYTYIQKNIVGPVEGPQTLDAPDGTIILDAVPVGAANEILWRYVTVEDVPDGQPNADVPEA